MESTPGAAPPRRASVLSDGRELTMLPPDRHADGSVAVPRAFEAAVWRSGERAGVWPPLAPGAARMESATDAVEVAVVCDSGGPTTVDATRMPIARVIEPLLAPPDRDRGSRALSVSADAWRRLLEWTLEQIAHGRIEPTTTTEGMDRWSLTAVEGRERHTRDRLVADLPLPAYAVVLAGVPSRVPTAGQAARWFVDGVVDSFVRTAAAPLVLGHDAYAGQTPVIVTGWGFGRPADDLGVQPAVGLRIVPPRLAGGLAEAVVQLRDPASSAGSMTARELWSALGARDALPDWLGRDPAAALLGVLHRSVGVWPGLAVLLEQREPSSMTLADTEVVALLGPLGAELASVGLEVLVPDGWLRRWTMSATVDGLAGAAINPLTAANPPTVGPRMDLSSVATLTWRAELDGEPLTDEELDVLAEAARPLVRLRGRWAVVDRRLFDRLGRSDELSLADALGAALSGSIVIDDRPTRVDLAESIDALARRLRDLARSTADRGAGRPEDGELARWAVPASLEATLRPYQRRGAGWLDELTRLGFGALLADDMGLGKTIQVLALVLAWRERERSLPPVLVVCPTSVVENWRREVARFAPSLPVRTYVGPDRELSGLAPAEIVVTSYGIARRDVTRLAAVEWSLVVADEAQNIKNHESVTARAMRRIGPGASRVALTGTPVQNRLADLWSLLDWTSPGLLGPLGRFQRDVAIPIERDGDDMVAARLAAMVSPFVMRRHKDDPEVAPDLPPKTETDHFTALTAEQAGLYREASRSIMGEVADASGIARRGLVLKLITALKQICNHPAHYLGDDGRLSGRSGKLEAFDELITAITEAGDSTLVFTQYVAMARLLERRLAELGIDSGLLLGETPHRRRSVLVDRFQEGAFPVFVISLHAGGTGLNLVRATHVVHYDRWWNPAVEQQASDRAWRIGQDRPVQIHRLVAEGTLEERIGDLLAAKARLAQSVVGGAESWAGELTDDELRELISLGGAR
ncbi:MAG: DEAD/DEAH box helicase [Microthrixaceae bacterium]